MRLQLTLEPRLQSFGNFLRQEDLLPVWPTDRAIGRKSHFLTSGWQEASFLPVWASEAVQESSWQDIWLPGFYQRESRETERMRDWRSPLPAGHNSEVRLYQLNPVLLVTKFNPLPHGTISHNILNILTHR